MNRRSSALAGRRVPSHLARGVQPRAQPWKIRPSLDLLRFCVAGLIIVSISTVQTYLGPLSQMRLGVLFAVVPLAIAVARPGTVRWESLARSKVSRWILLLLGLAFLSGPFGISLGGTARFILEIYSITIATFVLVTIAIRNTSHFAILVWAFVISAGILAFLSMTVLEFEGAPGALARLQGVSTYDANDLSMIFLMGLPLATMLFFNSGKLGKLVSGAIILAAPTSIAFTGSRGGFVGLVFVAPLLFLALDRIALGKRLAVVAAVAIALLVAAPAGYWDQMRTITATGENYNYTDEYGRLAIARRGLGYMAKYPVFGIGAGNFGRAEGTISPLTRNVAGNAIRWLAPHNTYVQVGAEMGVFALMIWFWILAFGVIRPRQLFRVLERHRGSANPQHRFIRDSCLFMPISFVAFGVTSFFLSHAYTAPVYVLFGLFAGLLHCADQLERDPTRQMRPQPMHSRRVPKSRPSVVGH